MKYWAKLSTLILNFNNFVKQRICSWRISSIKKYSTHKCHRLSTSKETMSPSIACIIIHWKSNQKRDPNTISLCPRQTWKHESLIPGKIVRINCPKYNRPKNLRSIATKLWWLKRNNPLTGKKLSVKWRKTIIKTFNTFLPSMPKCTSNKKSSMTRQRNSKSYKTVK